MDLEKFTQKAQQAVLNSQEIALANNHQLIENIHYFGGHLLVFSILDATGNIRNDSYITHNAVL